MQIGSYTSKGNKGKSIVFPKEWQEEGGNILLTQAIRVYESKKHPGLSKVKTRGEVAHSTRKIYRQKGTGSARHGDRGAPIFVKGGVAHGPKGIKKSLSLPKRMRRKALKIALSEKAKQGLLFALNNISQIKSTKEAANIIRIITDKEKDIGTGSKFTLVLAEENRSIKIYFRNIKNVRPVTCKRLNVYNVFYGGVLIVDDKVFDKNKEAGNKDIKKSKEKKNTKIKSLKSVNKSA